MKSLNGPFHLTLKSIDNYVLSALPGNFVLGEMRGAVFHVKFIGRADDCLNFRLKERLGRFTYFKFGYAQTAKEAFLKECRLYHEHLKTEGLENAEHPASPDPNVVCPHCAGA